MTLIGPSNIFFLASGLCLRVFRFSFMQLSGKMPVISIHRKINFSQLLRINFCYQNSDQDERQDKFSLRRSKGPLRDIFRQGPIRFIFIPVIGLQRKLFRGAPGGAGPEAVASLASTLRLVTLYSSIFQPIVRIK